MAHKPSNTLNMNLVKVKDRRELNDRAGVVYEIECKDCDKTYVGETGRKIGTRMNEHSNDIVKRKPASKVAMHTAETGHDMNVREPKVLYSE